MSVRTWLSIATIGLVALVIFLARHELVHAWDLLGKVDLWILALLVPSQIFSYYLAGEIIFSYLRAKRSIAHISHNELTRISLEVNFVNHILPSGGVSGISYVIWRFGKLGVSSSRALMANLVRYAMGFLGVMVMVAIATLVIILQGNINRFVALGSIGFVVAILGIVLLMMWVLGSSERVSRFSAKIVRSTNNFIKKITFGRVRHILKKNKVDAFFSDLQEDYVQLRRDRRILKKPFLIGLAFAVVDAGMYGVTFWALGISFDPALLLVGYAIAGLVAFFVPTPGGLGGFELVMIAFLGFGGMVKSEALAGVLLTRVILILGTIIFGYIFYQKSIMKSARKGEGYKR